MRCVVAEGSRSMRGNKQATIKAHVEEPPLTSTQPPSPLREAHFPWQNGEKRTAEKTPLTSVHACGIFVLAPEICTASIHRSAGCYLYRVALYGVLSALAETSYHFP